MKLLTEGLKKAIPPLYSQENNPGPMVVCKFFLPEGRLTFYVTEGGPETAQGPGPNEVTPTGDYRFFGYVVSPLGPDCDELGYFVLSELEELRSKRLRLPLERDLYWSPCPLSDVMEGKVR